MVNDSEKDQFDGKKGEASPIIHGLLRDPIIRVYGESKDYYYENGYYGDKGDQYLDLNFEEGLLLAERGRLIIHSTDEDSLDFENISAEELKIVPELSVQLLTQLITRKNPNFWGRYLVYKDLRSRGYVVRPGYGPAAPYRRYPRGAKANQAQSNALIYPFVEGTNMELYELEQLEELAHANRKALILGIVDRGGDVTYYRASEFTLNINTEQYEFRDSESNEEKNTSERPSQTNSISNNEIEEE